jgi:hypothetical protein
MNGPHGDLCSRAGRYVLRRLIEQHGRDATIVDWLDEITADCPRKDHWQHVGSVRGALPRSAQGF